MFPFLLSNVCRNFSNDKYQKYHIPIGWLRRITFPKFLSYSFFRSEEGIRHCLVSHCCLTLPGSLEVVLCCRFEPEQGSVLHTDRYSNLVGMPSNHVLSVFPVLVKTYFCRPVDADLPNKDTLNYH